MLATGAEIGLYLAIASILISVGTILTMKKPKAAPLDDFLGSSATMGAYIPLVIGRERVAPVFMWVEDATSAFNFGGGGGVDTPPELGKGSGGVPEPPQIWERSLHVLCVGPASKLSGIWQNGEQIWSGEITPASHPSGSSVTLQNAAGSSNSEGTFKIYWGFTDDPIVLPAPGGTAASRYPLAVKILWENKNLGQSRNWPRLEYEVTCPCYSQITSSASETPLTGDKSKPPYVTWYDETINDSPYERRGYSYGTFSGTSATRFNNISWAVIQSSAIVFTPDLYVQSERKIKVIDRITYNPGNSSNVLWGGSNTANANGLSSYGFQRTKAIQGLFPPGGIIAIHCLNSASLPGLFSSTENLTWKYFWISKTVEVPPSGVGSSGAAYVAHSSQTVNSGVFPTVYSSGYVDVYLGPEVSSDYLVQTSQNIVLPTSTAGISPAPFCYVTPCSTKGTDGINPVHMVDQLLFAKFPYGAGRDRSKFDTRSIEAVAEVIQREKIRGGIAIFDGEGLESALSPILQDLGMMIAWDPEVGKYVFRLIRYEETGLNIPKDLILKEPSMTAVQGDRPIDVVAFTYKDRDRNYREVPIKVIDSGQISEYQSQRAQKVPIEVTKDRDSISRIAPRRQQEALTNLSSFNFEMNHGCQMAVPGSRFRVSEFEGEGLQFLTMNVRRFLNSSKVEIEAMVDSYNAPLLEGTDSAPGLDDLPITGEGVTTVAALTDFQAYELPFGSEIALTFLAARGDTKTVAANVWGSKDGTAYTSLGEGVLAVRGVLSVELPADSAQVLEGPIAFTSDLDFDLGQIEDLTLDPAAWRSGRQLMLIGNEIIYLKNGYPYELVGLIRGRFGTLPQTHAAGTPFYIVSYYRLVATKSLMYSPGGQIYYKGQAASLLRSSDITAIDSKTVTLTGAAFTPKKPGGLRLSSLRNTYENAAATITVLWTYESNQFPNTGLGMQPLGNAVGDSAVEGYFLVTIRDDLGAKLAALTADTNQQALSSAYRDELGLDDLPFWTLEVAHVKGSYTSPTNTITLSAV